MIGIALLLILIVSALVMAYELYRAPLIPPTRPDAVPQEQCLSLLQNGKPERISRLRRSWPRVIQCWTFNPDLYWVSTIGCYALVRGDAPLPLFRPIVLPCGHVR